MHSLATSTLAWVGFCSCILIMLAVDLGVFNRKPHEITTRNAAIWSGVWITLALIFAGLLFGPLGWELFAAARHQKGLEFVTGYLIELSLSVDNLFAFLLIFSYFKVPANYQLRVLLWGVLAALVFGVTTDRFIVSTSNVFAILGLRTFYFLLAGVVEKFHYLKLGLGVVLGFIGVKMLLPLLSKVLAALVGAAGGESLATHIRSADHIPIGIALGIVAVVLLASVAASLIWPRKPSPK